ncbi:MAG: protein kinase [Symploca sp. SIO3E6]|nr:protein kinase [Caldora sp. SIO3E6]
MESILAGHYTIVKPLGSGGFGQTFLARDSHLPDNPLCVVKQLKPRVKDSATLKVAKRLFEQEAQTLSKLGNHDQIPRLLAHFEQNEEFYLVQDFIEGQLLSQELIPGQKLMETYVIELLQDILQVLSFVHQQQVIHRDIKPANLIRRSQDRKIVLIDFGAVKKVSSQIVNSSGQTSLTVAVGSPGYMPSEQLAFRPHLSSDIYAVGMICLNALTGLSPRDQEIPQDSQGEFCCAALQDIAPVSPDLATIIDKMVRYDYRQRYATATEALQALQQMTSKQSVSDATATLFIPTFSGQPTTWEQPEGEVSLNSPLYIERPPIEAQCYEAILQPGALIRIKAPKQMGKTWLMDKILGDAAREGYKTVPLNLLRADHSVIAHLDKFLRWFCARVSRQLQLPNQLADFWDEDLGSNDNCMSYFEEYLLAKIDTPLVLGLDNVDRVFPYHTVAPDFFGLLRACHEAGNRGEIWQNLRLVVAHSTEIYIPLNVNQSPFNVGLPIELPEFSPEQVQELALKHQLDCNEAQLEQLREMIGGHPDLVQQAFAYLRDYPDTKLEDILAVAPTEAGLYNRHLREHLLALQQDAKLAVAMKKIVNSTSPVRVEVEEAFKLQSMGLVHKQGNEVMPSCLLYRLYFRDRLEVNL